MTEDHDAHTDPTSASAAEGAAVDATEELLREIAGQEAAVRATVEDAALGVFLDHLAERVRTSGELLVTGMGASLHAGSILAALLRADGWRAWALPTSELLHYASRLPVRPVLVVSQSGASVEIERLVARGDAGLFGLTLAPDSPLGRYAGGASAAPVGPPATGRSAAAPAADVYPGSGLGSARGAVIPGGVERAYAATRSFTTTMAALFALAARLGVPVDPVTLAASMRPAPGRSSAVAAELDEAIAALAGANAVFVTGRGPLYGLAEYVALLLMELARVPCAALEAAQFRHGPREAAGAGLAALALTARGPTTELVRRFASEVAGLGSPTVVLDAGDPAHTAGVLTLTLPPAAELAAVLPMAVLAQRLAVGLAEAHGVRPGAPLHSSKVTREE